MDFARDLARLLQEERDAIHEYQELAASAPNEITRRVMLKISREEERHADFLARILEECCEKIPPAPMPDQDQPKRIRPKSRVGNKKHKYL